MLTETIKTRLTNKQASELLKGLDNNTIFNVTFIKRTTGEIRTMLCRKGVNKFVKGTGKPRNDAANNLITVFDIQAHQTLKKQNPDADEQIVGEQCYRSINLEAIIEIKAGGRLYKVNDWPMRTYEFHWIKNGTEMKREIVARTADEAKTSFKREMGVKTLPKGLSVV